MSQTPPPTMPHETPANERPQTLAMTSMILGIASFVLCFVPIGPIPLGLFSAIAAIVVGYMARGAIARGEQSGDGMAKAGIILGIVNLALSLLLLILALLGVAGLMYFGTRAAEEAERQQRQPGAEPVEVEGVLRIGFDYVATIVSTVIRAFFK